MPTTGATRSASARPGLTLVEVVAATMIVAIMSVAALNSLGAATRSAESTGNRAVALGLADQLLTEILRAEYNQLDTYDDRDESLTGDRTDWRRRAYVENVAPTDTSQTVGADQGAKRIHVTVEYFDAGRGEWLTLTELFAIKTNHP